MNLQRLLPRLATLLVAGLLLSGPAWATWSIVVVNKKTGEVCVASATCLGGNFPLKRWLPVIVVGKGAAAAQSAIDQQGYNRARIWAGLHDELTPQAILDILESNDGGHESRQYGIVSFAGQPVTFTGASAGEGKHELVGETEDLLYAIQGNVITGDPVVDQAELALVNTPGDLGQRVMAAMEAARAMGGDGRCSCGSDPDGCGSPPPNFSKSAHTAFIVLARRGNKDGVCNVAEGCASGGYYLSLVVKGVESDPEPIFELQAKYDTWRQDLVDVADHVTSRLVVDRDALVADGLARAKVRIELRDVDGNTLSSGGHKFQVRWVGQGPPTARPGEVTDLGAGRYSFKLTATEVVGQGSWVVRCKRAGDKWVQLADPLVLPSEAVVELHAGRKSVQDQSVPFTLNRGALDAGRGYLLLGSASGTSPGTPFENIVIPLNPDRFFDWTWGTPRVFHASSGLLDAEGRAEAVLGVPPGTWAPLVGTQLAFCGLIGGPPYDVTNVQLVEVTP